MSAYEMPRLARPFTQHTVIKSTPRQRPYEIRDGGCRGLILRVQPSGAKLWYAAVRSGRRYALGTAGAISLSTARHLAEKYRAVNGVPHDVSVSRNTSEGSTAFTLQRFVNERYKPWFESQNARSRGNLNNFNLFKPLASKRLDELTPQLLDSWVLDRLKVAGKATVKRNLATLKAALSQAVRWELIEKNPLMGYSPVKRVDEPRTRYLLPKEEQKLRTALRTAPPYFHAMVLLALNTGLRRGELFRLTWGDLDLKRRMLTVRAESSKSARARHVPLNQDARDALQQLNTGAENDAVFMGRYGSALANVAKPWARLMEACGINDLTFHSLRHTFASKLVQRGVDLYQVQKLLGHSDPKLTARYSHFAPDHLRAAVSVLETRKLKRN